MDANTARKVAQHYKDVNVPQETDTFKKVDKNFDSCQQNIMRRASTGHYDTQCYITKEHIKDRIFAHGKYCEEKIGQLQRDGFDVTNGVNDVHIKVSWKMC